MTESQQLLQALRAICPELQKQKDIERALGVTQGYISRVLNRDDSLVKRFGAKITLLIMDKIDHLTDHTLIYQDVREIAKYYIELHQREDFTPEQIDDSFQTALKIYRTGFAII